MLESFYKEFRVFIHQNFEIDLIITYPFKAWGISIFLSQEHLHLSQTFVLSILKHILTLKHLPVWYSFEYSQNHNRL